MRFPSITRVFKDAIGVILRFPVEILFALAGTIAACVNYELEYNDYETADICHRIMMAANIGLLVSLAASLFAERIAAKLPVNLLLRLPGVGIGVAFYLAVHPRHYQNDWIRFMQLSLALHLLIAFVPFTRGGNVNAFWQFNKTLFLRFLAGVLYCGVLYGGLAAALGALNFLFNTAFEGDAFFFLFCWIAGIFQTLFFLSGVPNNFVALETSYEYPRALKVFTQYVLIPLAAVYLLILLSYEVKIILEGHLPKGLVSNLVLGYAVYGILSMLLVYPIRNQEGNRWIKTFSRFFFILLVPLLGLLYVAVGTRVGLYGITEQRYFLLVLAGWLSLITAYFIFSKKQNIILIPLSLCILTLLTVYGPQSAFSTAQRSQLGQLYHLLEKNKAVKDGKFVPLTANLDSVDSYRIQSTFNYLVNTHGVLSLQPYMQRDLRALTDSIKDLNEKQQVHDTKYPLTATQWLEEYLNLEKYEYHTPVNDDEFKVNVTAPKSALPISGADFLEKLSYSNYNKDNDTSHLEIGGEAITVVAASGGYIRVIHKQDTSFLSVKKFVNSLVPLLPVKDTIIETFDDASIESVFMTTIPYDKLTVSGALPGFDYRLVFTDISIEHTKKQFAANSYQYYILFNRKKQGKAPGSQH